MSKRVFNFNAGPATLPEPVLIKIQTELLDYNGTGMSVMESSHRSAEFDEINNRTIELMLETLGLGDDYSVLFLGGGASTQFAMIPMNFLAEGKTAAYIDTGSWSSKAIKEANKIGNVDVVASSKDNNYTHIPDLSNLKLSADLAYLHMTSNNTIYGTQYHQLPDTGDVPLICDMSSDIASRQMDFSHFAMIYAGAQKNMGPSGVAVVIIRKDLLTRSSDDLHTYLNYSVHAEKASLYNTPPTFSIYVIGLVYKWLLNLGGLDEMYKINLEKVYPIPQSQLHNPIFL